MSRFNDLYEKLYLLKNFTDGASFAMSDNAGISNTFAEISSRILDLADELDTMLKANNEK